MAEKFNGEYLSTSQRLKHCSLLYFEYGPVTWEEDQKGSIGGASSIHVPERDRAVMPADEDIVASLEANHP